MKRFRRVSEQAECYRPLRWVSYGAKNVSVGVRFGRPEPPKPLLHTQVWNWRRGRNRNRRMQLLQSRPYHFATPPLEKMKVILLSNRQVQSRKTRDLIRMIVIKSTISVPFLRR